MSAKRNYDLMERLGLLAVESHKTFKSPGFMDLSVEWISYGPTDTKWEVLSLAHYGEMNGDAMRDPEVLALVRRGDREAYGIYFRNDYLPTEREVYEFDDGGQISNVNMPLREDLTGFLYQWLRNINQQGHCD